MQKHSYEVIGTHLSLHIDAPQEIGELFQEIEKRLSTFEKIFSRFIPGNWLDTLNKERSAILDEDGKNMLAFALEVAQNTHGYFDPTVWSRLSTLWYGLADDAPHTVNYKNIHIEGNHVELTWDVVLEFWWVGKGYLIDIVKKMIDTFFLSFGSQKPRYLIDFWGDLYGVWGFKIWLENPHELDEVIGVIVLDDTFLACSSGSKRKWGNHHHLIDPKTGESAREVIASYIEWSSGILVDSYATALCVMPYEKACATLEQNESIEGIVLASDGRYFQSQGSKSELFTA